MAGRNRGWHSSPSTSSSDHGSYREPVVAPMNQAVSSWLLQLKHIWGLWKKSDGVTKMLHEYYASAPNPYSASLEIMIHCDDLKQAKPNSLAYTVMEEFSRWVSSRRPDFKHCLSKELKLHAFNHVIRLRNIALLRLTCNVYEMIEDKELFLDPIRFLLSCKQYKEGCQVASLLNLHSHFTIEDFIIPLVLQDKMSVAEEFLANSPTHQQQLVIFLDGLLGKRNIRNEAETIIHKLQITDVHTSKLYYKPLSKLVARLTKLYDLPPEICPNLNQKRNEGAIQFLLHKRYQENSLGVESWREMVREAVGTNPHLQNEVVINVANSGDTEEAMYWAKEFCIPRSKWPYYLEMYASKNKELSFRSGQRALQKSDSQRTPEPEEDWDTNPGLEYHLLNLPDDCVVMVDTRRLFEHFVNDIAEVPMVGIDSEWKPFFGTRKSELALIQIATHQKVYILDVTLLGSSSQDLWRELGSRLFGNENIIKLGFGLNADMIMIKHSLPYLGAVFQTASSYLDLLLLWKKLIKDYPFVFPYSGVETSSGESLAHLVELCVGRQLNKSDQFSNWEKRPLRPSQIHYAALDSYCLLEVYNVLQQCSHEQEIPFHEICNEVMTNIKSPKKGSKHSKKRTKSEPPEEVPPSPFLEPIPARELRLVCDTTLDGVGKQLRKCGVDTWILGSHENHDRCVRIANQQGRMIITRGRNVWRKISKHLPPGYCYQVMTEGVDNQLKEVLQYFNVVLTKDDVFSRCKLCNGNEFVIIPQAVMKQLAQSYQQLAGSLTVPEDTRWDAEGEGFSSESDAYSDEGTGVPNCHLQPQNASQLYENVDIGRCLTKKGVTIQVQGIPPHLLEQLQEFNICETCGKCYWDGSHFERFVGSRLKDLV